METGLQLLMRDDAVRVAFQPHLTAEQYTELLARVRRPTTKAELRREMEEAAKHWGSGFEFDSAIE